jgi:transcription elongation factor GreA
MSRQKEMTMVENANLITREGYEDLNRKMFQLQNVDRKNVIEEISNARSFGNDGENSEYTYAKQKQDQIESKISELAEYLSTCRIIEVGRSGPSDKVSFGSTVTILNLDTENETTFQVVGETESDPKRGKISYKSPIGKAMLGLRVGDDFEVETPGGDQYWEIEDIS